MKKKLLGFVGVDSGQLIITDPCYIDSEWEEKDFKDIRIYEETKGTKQFMYTGLLTKTPQIPCMELFDSYDKHTSTGKSMNEMIENGDVIELGIPGKLKLIGSFSYAGVCETSLANKHQINYKKGHPGLAIVFKSGYGDGSYPVYGTFNKDNRCIKVEIDCSETEIQSKFLKQFHENNRTKE
jgi:hypothetical protein